MDNCQHDVRSCCYRYISLYDDRIFAGWFYRFSTSFSFSLKMFLSSPRVDSLFSREKFCSPSAPRSVATHELSSVTVLSSNCHSLTRVSHLAIHSSEISLTLAYLSLSAATSASSKTFKCLMHPASKLLTTANMALASSKVWGLLSPSRVFFSASTNQGLTPLIPVLYSAQNLTSSEKLSQVC